MLESAINQASLQCSTPARCTFVPSLHEQPLQLGTASTRENLSPPDPLHGKIAGFLCAHRRTSRGVFFRRSYPIPPASLSPAPAPVCVVLQEPGAG